MMGKSWSHNQIKTSHEIFRAFKTKKEKYERSTTHSNKAKSEEFCNYFYFQCY